MQYSTVDFPLSEDPSLAQIECAMLSNRMRTCWSLWNRGHPFDEIVDHRYSSADDRKQASNPASYSVTFADDDEMSDSVIEHLSPLLLARFIMEMSVLHRSALLDGHFHCVLRSSPAPRLVLRPAVPKFRGKRVSLHSRSSKSVASRGRKLDDLAGLLEIACSVLSLSIGKKPKSGLSPEEAALWLHSTLGAIQMPVDETRLIAKRSEGFICASTSEEMIHCEACYYKDGTESSSIRLQSRGRAGLVRINEQDILFEPREESPRIRVAPIHGRPDKVEFLDYETYRLWSDCMANWTNDRNLKEVTRMEAALLSEEMQLLKSCYPVELVPPSEAGTKTGQHAYRLLVNNPHPVFGKMKRVDGGRMVDTCIEEGNNMVCINSNPEPLDFEGATYEIIRTKDDNPNVLILRESEITGARPPEKGWLRAVDRGSASLRTRKRSLISEATGRKSVRRALRPPHEDDKQLEYAHHRKENEVEDWLERHRGWRLDSGGEVQFVQGPPGTGKTWTATRLVEDILRERPDSRILLCAKEHLPLDHLTKSVIKALESEEFRGVSVVRLVGGRRRDSGEIDKAISCDEEGHRKVNGLISSVMELSEDEGFQHRIGKIKATMTQQGHRATWPGEFNAREASVVCVTATDSEMALLVKDGLDSFDYAIVEEAGKSFPSELLAAISISRNTILIGDQMQLPPFEIKSIRDNLSKIVSLDMSKIPEGYNRRLKRLLKELKFTYYKTSAKEKLDDIAPWLEPFKTLYDRSEEVLGGHSSTMLREQRRMFEELSDIVGEVFYSGSFEWRKEGGIDDDDLPSPFDRLGRLILVDTPHCSLEPGWRENRSKSGSRCNKMEAEEVAKAAVAIASSGSEVVVLSPYLGQVDLIKRRLSKVGSKVGVFTVDGYQGKEADFVLLSLTRNNDKTGRRRWGFVSDLNRLNVALSRAKEGLIVFASMGHLYGSEFDDGFDHLRVALDIIAQRCGTRTLDDFREAL